VLRRWGSILVRSILEEERCESLFVTQLLEASLRSNSALGHPLGCTGVRQIVTALSELRRRKANIAVTSMCVGTVSAISLHASRCSAAADRRVRGWVWLGYLFLRAEETE
jgi:hypothetical protein